MDNYYYIEKFENDIDMVIEGNVTSNNIINIDNQFGKLRFGSMNNNWTHFITDKDRYYFNKHLISDNNGTFSSYNNKDFHLKAGHNNPPSIIINNSTGFVGIKNTSPKEQLDINGNFNVSGDIIINGNLIVNNINITNYFSSLVETFNDMNVNNININSGVLNIHNNSGNTFIGSRNRNWSHITTDRSRFYFNRNIVIDGKTPTLSSYSHSARGARNLELKAGHSKSTTIIINSLGNVGINNNNPIHTFDVNGNVNINGDVNISNKLFINNVDILSKTTEGFEELKDLVVDSGNLIIKNRAFINNQFGNLRFGPMNTSFSHFYSDKPNYYFNKEITVDGPVSSYGTRDLSLKAGHTNKPSIIVNNLTGFVGINNNSPITELDVNGNVIVNDSLFISGNIILNGININELLQKIEQAPEQIPQTIKQQILQKPEQIKQLIEQAPEQIKQLIEQKPEQIKQLIEQAPEQIKQLIEQAPEKNNTIIYVVGGIIITIVLILFDFFVL